MKRLRLSLQGKFIISIALIIVPSLSVIFVWAGYQHEKLAVTQLVGRARVLARQVILTRQWVSDCGGVMVDKRSAGARNTAIIYDDRMDTPRGVYQRFTPSMVTKKLSQYSLRQEMYGFRLVSLRPMNPDNLPDPFERVALTRFSSAKSDEEFRFQIRGGVHEFQYMVPLHMDKSCLGCHSKRGADNTAVYGGLSVFFPIEREGAYLKISHIKLAIAGIGMILAVTFTLFILLRRVVIKPLSALEAMTSEIGEGNYDAKVFLATGDEFEQLGDAFNFMGGKLSFHREQMKKEIEKAVAELSDANGELKTLDKLKSDFLANMSHELRSPLTVIRGGVDYLERTEQDEDKRNYLTIIDKNLRRLIHLVTDIFDFTKIEGGKADWSFQEEDVAALVADTLEIIGPLAAERNIALRYDNPGVIVAAIDLERMEQVLVNLIENAVKFSEEGAAITIAAGKEGRAVVVSVRDCGPGIPPEKLELIFEKFHTLPSSGKREKPKGTGLGLAISRKIVEAHGGVIRAENVEGGGSRFIITIPENAQGRSES